MVDKADQHKLNAMELNLMADKIRSGDDATFVEDHPQMVAELSYDILKHHINKDDKESREAVDECRWTIARCKELGAEIEVDV